AYVARISRLDDRALTVLETIAIGGGEVSDRDLRAVSELNDAELVEPQRQLESAGLIDIDSQREAVSYRCSHPVITRVAYDRIPVSQRQQRHARFIEILEKESGVSEALVWHYRLVGGEVDQSRRLEILSRAGRRALAKYANEDAVQILRTALDVARSFAPVGDISVLLEDLGEAVHRTGEERAAIKIWREASSITQHVSDQVRLTRRIAAAESNLGNFREALRQIDGGMSALADETSPEAVELLAVGALTSFRAGDIDSAAAGIDRLDRLVSIRPSEQTTMNLAILKTGLAMERSSYERAKAEARVAYDLAKAVNDPVSEQQALAFLALVDLSLGDLVGLDRLLAANLDLTERIGIGLRAYRLLLYQYEGAICAGQWEHAEDVAIEGALLANTIEESPNRVVLVIMPSLLDILKGDFELAASRLAEARQALEALGRAEPRLPALLDIVDAWSDLESGQPAKALTTLERRDGEFLQGLLPPWGMMLLGEAQARVGDESWTVTAEQLAAMGSTGSLPWVWSRRLGALAAADPEVASEEWTQAADGFNDLGMPFEAARARLRAAELKAPRGPLAVDGLKEDHRLFAGLGATRYRDRTQKLLRSVGEAFSVGESRDAGALSPRQTEVARLVAEGLSNGDIADRLFISRRTVTTHLENIYRQLGMGSRTALTRYVLEQMQ
ncbi:MAG: LuxR C-terminal-related transcriptional regulator, partial [Acidimicrobiia bacterium]